MAYDVPRAEIHPDKLKYMGLYVFIIHISEHIFTFL